MPNYQSGPTPRTIVGVWTKIADDKMRQYALWSSGEIITRNATEPDRVGLWQPRLKARFSGRLIIDFDKRLRSHGYARDYIASRKILAELL